ncbi:MAG: type I DNA topoisomerase [Elusimicrobia bacterium]|nr:type I DNA topoisomerase [Elusimicrobiota bacterium]
MPVKSKSPPKKRSAPRVGSGAALVIVESPAKQKTISRFLHSGYVVRSSYGHVRDLPERALGVDEKKDFEPTYVLLPRTRKLLPELKKLADRATTVYLATDHDREGESIAWHLAHLLELSAEKIRRITFHEITPKAIEDALKNPRGIDMSLVQAQQARRVLDRLVGYKLSPLLWKKIRRGLSAGRVQSVAVRLLVERDREIKAFESAPYWTLNAALQGGKDLPAFSARLIQWRGEKIESTLTHELFAETYRVQTTCFKAQADIDAVVSAVRATPFTVSAVERKEVRRQPQPPFTTSTLQQAASVRHGFSAQRTMRVAQNLYEGVSLAKAEAVGLITYMRTDSVSVARSAQEATRSLIRSLWGDPYLPAEIPVFQTKTRGAQEAHEAIRPTDPSLLPETARPHLDPDQAKLYDLIWKRFVASQAAAAVYDTVSADIKAGDALFRSTGRTLKFEGYLRAYRVETEPAEKTENGEEDAEALPESAAEQEGMLPPLAAGDVLNLIEMAPQEHRTSPPPHYNEASLIRALEKHGIGRPSTYAPTIQTIIDRGYAQRGEKDRRLLPSELGGTVTDKLREHFPEIVSLSYTADVEERLDRIAEGQAHWQQVVQTFYRPFEKALKGAATAMKAVQPRQSDEKCPLCATPMLIRESRFGKYLSCPQFPQCKGKVRLSSEGKKVVPEMTKEVCEVCGKAMVIRMGRRGRFLACSGYPACKNTYSLDAEGNKIAASRPVETSRKCEKCGSALWMRLGRRGHFLACSGYPKCRNLKPVSKEEAESLRKEASSSSGAGGS